MDIPNLTESEMKLAAFSSAMVSALASVACENALLRSILKARGFLSDEEWTTQLREFAASKWETFHGQIDAKVRQESKRVLARMKRGPVQ
jgi:hypothetical protein